MFFTGGLYFCRLWLCDCFRLIFFVGCDANNEGEIASEKSINALHNEIKALRAIAGILPKQSCFLIRLTT